jgi:hypothetical protein
MISCNPSLFRSAIPTPAPLYIYSYFMTLKLSVSVIVFLKSMPVCFELNNWNFVDLEQDKNNTAHISNKYFLIGYVIIITITCSNPAKIKKSGLPVKVVHFIIK